ncbi:hypothetical protein JB92DRAFT_1461941 [Gautieria morchelliformis]|nr:hypothetical protein JB92DRAFT_1461941 [Gautieria morchelliformis]
MPTALTTVILGTPTVIKTLTTPVVQTVSGVPTTVTSLTTVNATTVLAVTVKPGGQVAGSEPAKVSQQTGGVAPTFNSNPLPPSGASTLTFTGPAGYSTAVPVPTSSSTTIPIGAIFGGGEIILGPLGIILGNLPAGVVEVGGLYPVPRPPAGGGGPTPTSNPSTSSSSSTMSSTSSSAACTPIAVSCDTECYGDFGLTSDFISDMDLNNDDDLSIGARRRRATSDRRRAINGCQTVKTTSDGAKTYTRKSVTHKMFDFSSADGNSFSLKSSFPELKPKDAISERR